MYFCPKKQNNFQYILKEKNTFQHLSPCVNIEPVSDGLKRELQLTSDGSHTLYMPDMDEHYHSVNGAIQESEHVFIEAGLHRLPKKEIRVLEIGFGTGLIRWISRWSKILITEKCCVPGKKTCLWHFMKLPGTRRHRSRPILRCTK